MRVVNEMAPSGRFLTSNGPVGNFNIPKTTPSLASDPPPPAKGRAISISMQKNRKRGQRRRERLREAAMQ